MWCFDTSGLECCFRYSGTYSSMLIEDLETIGVENDALELMRSYIEGRTYCVQIGDVLSGIHNLSRGVPQGSVFGPILFCIYIL